MKILGNSIQEGIPTPESPKEINTTTKIIIKGQNGEMQEIEFPKEKIDGIFIKENGKWYLRKEEQMNEEEAIERCKELLKIEHSNWIGITNQVAISTVLTLIEKQQKEIEHQKEKRENQKNELAILNAKQIEFNKMKNTIKSYKGQFKRQEKEIEKQNKVIAEMTNELNKLKEKLDIKTEGEEDCFIPNEYSSIDECVKQKSCKDCIKQYFIRKVEENDKD